MNREERLEVHVEREEPRQARQFRPSLPYWLGLFWGGWLLSGQLLEVTFFPAAGLADLAPRVSLLVVVAAASSGGEREGAWVGLGSGLLADLAEGRYIGQGVLRALLGYGAGRIRRRFFAENPLLAGALAAVAAAADGLLRMAVPAAFGARLPWRELLPAQLWPALSTFLLAPALLPPVQLARRALVARARAGGE